MAATSQLAWLISTTATMVVSCSKGMRDLLRVVGLRHGALRRLAPAAIVLLGRRAP